MVIKTKLINSEKVKPIITNKHNKEDILGGDMFDLYSNIYIGAKKMSGKSTTLAHILKKCCNKLTTIIIFSSTINKDPTMLEIIRMLRNKGCNVITHEHFIDGKVNILEDLIDELKKEEENDSDIESDEEVTFEDFVSGLKNPKIKSEDEKKKKKYVYKPKKIAPKYFLVMDDMGNDMRNNQIYKLLLKNRHFFMKTCLVSHFATDLTNQARKQLDYVLLFKSFNEEKLKTFYDGMDLSIDFDKFLQLYEYATKEKFNFLYIDVKNEKFRKNFNEELNFE